jgi:lysozyme
VAGSNEIPGRPDWWGEDLNGTDAASGAEANSFPVDPNDPAFQPPPLKMDPSTMGASDKLKDYLRAREVYKAHIYNDNPKHPENGTRTIGYGHTGNVDAIASQYPPSQYPQGLPEPAARSILDSDLAPVEETVRKHLKVPVTQSQFDALVDYAFNAGPGAFLSSPMLSHLNSGDAPSAAKDFGTTRITQKGQPVRGLQNRRADETDMFQMGDRVNTYNKR